jgi:S1-C subfamily serine protease
MDAETLNWLQSLNDGLANTVERVHRSLVQISNGRGAGAGTIWHSDGLIITNAHVVHGHHNLHVTLPDGRKLPSQVIAFDRESDLAALSVQADALPTIELGDSRLLKPGQWVMAVGHPWGVQGAITSGVVIGTGANLPEVPPGREWIALGPDVGFAIPVQAVKSFLKQSLGTQKIAV